MDYEKIVQQILVNCIGAITSSVKPDSVTVDVTVNVDDTTITKSYTLTENQGN